MKKLLITLLCCVPFILQAQQPKFGPAPSKPESEFRKWTKQQLKFINYGR